MAKIFISYRRDDSAAMTGRIFDRLASQFGRESVFMDVDTIPFGIDFRQHISNAVGQCDVILAVIGEKWGDASQIGGRRLDDPNDFVRVELEIALRQEIPIIPVLVGRSPMPKPSELPSSLEDFAYRNAAQVDVGKDFHAHMNRLIRGLETLLKPAKVAAESASVLVGEQDHYVVKQKVTGNPYITLELEGTSDRSEPISFNASEDRRIIIGRASDCDVCLTDHMASRKHAMIIYDLSRGWMLQDLASSNGVLLNGTIVENMGLKVGDRIKIGSTEILVWEATGADSAG